MNNEYLRRHLEAIRGLLRRDSVSDSDRETDKRYAEKVSAEIEKLLSDPSQNSNDQFLGKLLELATDTIAMLTAIIVKKNEQIDWQDAKLAELSAHFKRMTADIEELTRRLPK